MPANDERPGTPHPASLVVSEPIDLCYPLAQGGSHYEDLELRYSLRSVDANLRLPVRDLYLFGDRPGWLRNTVRHVPMVQLTDKARDITAKYRKMCATETLSDPFLLLDDDHIFLQPTTEIPVYTRGLLAAALVDYGDSTYGRYIRACYDQLVQRGLPTKNYQVHFPMVIHKDRLRAALRLMTEPMVMGSLYGNMLDGPTVEIDHDFKVKRKSDFPLLRDGSFCSFQPWLIPEWTSFLEQRFPLPSRWEIASPRG